MIVKFDIYFITLFSDYFFKLITTIDYCWNDKIIESCNFLFYFPKMMYFILKTIERQLYFTELTINMLTGMQYNSFLRVYVLKH